MKVLENKSNIMILRENETVTLISYKSVIAKYNKKSNQLILGKDWAYSTTTLQHLNHYLEKYCYTIYSIINEFKQSKKTTIQNMIEQGFITYNESMV